MDAAHLQFLLSRLGAVRNGSYYTSACPVCQPQEEDRERWKLNITPGAEYPVLFYCHKGCCSKGDQVKNRAFFNQLSSILGVDPALLRTKRDAGRIRYLWSQIGCSTSESRPLPAEPALLNSVYCELLDHLTLSEAHRKWLDKRGLDPHWAYGAGYRSTPEDPTPIAKELWSTWGFKLSCVPGFGNVFEERSIRLLTRTQAILTPCRNSNGDILALKQRLLDGGKGRLRLLGNSQSGGPTAVTLAHVPLGVGGHLWEELWVVEGERKGDVNWSLANKPSVAIPGTGNWSRACEGVKGLLKGQGKLIVAMDKDNKPQTLKAEQELVKWGRGEGYEVLVAKWEKGKGVDDALRLGVEIKLESPKELNTSIPHSSAPIPVVDSRLKDWEICNYIKEKGPLPRCALPLRHSRQESLISGWIREGKLRIKEKTSLGQILEAGE